MDANTLIDAINLVCIIGLVVVGVIVTVLSLDG